MKQTDLGERLILLRKLKNDIPLGEVEEATGISKSLISRYETGKSEPGLTNLLILARYYGVSLDWLCGEEDIHNIKFITRMDAYKNRVKDYFNEKEKDK